jgi:hypothetical protein
MVRLASLLAVGVVMTGCAIAPEELSTRSSGSLCVAYARAVLNPNREDWLAEVYRRGDSCAPYAAEMAAASAQSQSSLNSLNQRYMQPAVPVQRPATAFLKGEFTQGFNKVCMYDRMGSPVHVTIPATQLCPLTQ